MVRAIRYALFPIGATRRARPLMNETMKNLHAPSYWEVASRARKDLWRARSAYRLIADIRSVSRRAEAMRVCVDRPYVFELNETRWPGGLYHLLGRDYMPWRHHNLAFARETLVNLGVVAWCNSPAVSVGSPPCFLMVVDEVLQNNPKPDYLRRLADMLDAMADML
jgi:hypothetical protein